VELKCVGSTIFKIRVFFKHTIVFSNKESMFFFRSFFKIETKLTNSMKREAEDDILPLNQKKRQALSPKSSLAHSQFLEAVKEHFTNLPAQILLEYHGPCQELIEEEDGLSKRPTCHCFASCDRCKRLEWPSRLITCECLRYVCSKCLPGCSACEEAVCRDCLRECSDCSKKVCENCLSCCENCDSDEVRCDECTEEHECNDEDAIEWYESAPTWSVAPNGKVQ